MPTWIKDFLNFLNTAYDGTADTHTIEFFSDYSGTIKRDGSVLYVFNSYDELEELVNFINTLQEQYTLVPIVHQPDK